MLSDPYFLWDTECWWHRNNKLVLTIISTSIWRYPKRKAFSIQTMPMWILVWVFPWLCFPGKSCLQFWCYRCLDGWEIAARLISSSTLLIYQVDGNRAGTGVTVSLPSVIQVSDGLLEGILNAPAALSFSSPSVKGKCQQYLSSLSQCPLSEQDSSLRLTRICICGSGKQFLDRCKATGSRRRTCSAYAISRHRALHVICNVNWR